MPELEEPPHRRTDDGWLCWTAARASEGWEWIDKRQIDRHVVAGVTLWGTVRITEWAMAFTSAHPEKPGLEVAAIIAALLVPWSALQTAAIKFYFDARAG